MSGVFHPNFDAYTGDYTFNSSDATAELRRCRVRYDRLLSAVERARDEVTGYRDRARTSAARRAYGIAACEVDHALFSSTHEASS